MAGETLQHPRVSIRGTDGGVEASNGGRVGMAEWWHGGRAGCWAERALMAEGIRRRVARGNGVPPLAKGVED